MYWPLVKNEVTTILCAITGKTWWETIVYFLTNRNPFSCTPKLALLGMWFRSKARCCSKSGWLCFLMYLLCIWLSKSASDQQVPTRLQPTSRNFWPTWPDPWSSSQAGTVGKNRSDDSYPSHLDIHDQWICVIRSICAWLKGKSLRVQCCCYLRSWCPCSSLASTDETSCDLQPERPALILPVNHPHSFVQRLMSP